MLFRFERTFKNLFNFPKYSKKQLFYIFLVLFIFFISLRYVYNLIWTMSRLKLLNENIGTLSLVQPTQRYDPVDTWQFIGEPKRRQQIFSAYFDPRMQPLVQVTEGDLSYGSVRIFAVLTLYKKEQIYCIFKHQNNTRHVTKAYEALPIHEHFEMEFSAYIIACPLSEPEHIREIYLPVSVAIAYHDDQRTFTHPTFVTIRYGKGNLYEGPDMKMSVCVGPLQQNYNEALRIVEFIEINRLLGIEKFYLYNLTSTEDVGKVLHYYEKEKIVEIINWNFHGYKFEDEVRYNGILVSINECLYRSTFIDNFKYVAIIDFDEVLIPFKHVTLLDYVTDKLEQDNYDDISAFIFRGIFFHKRFQSDYSSLPSNLKIQFLYTQTKIERTSQPYKAHSRSKYIANARSIIETGSHEIWRSLPKYREYIVPAENGLLFHYRTDCFSKEPTCDGPTVIDFSARRFGSLLWYKVDTACEEIFVNYTCPKSDWDY